MKFANLVAGGFVVVSFFFGCASFQGGRIKTSYDAPLPQTYAVVQQSLEKIGFTVTKDDLVSGEIQGASQPYGIRTQQCKNELWVFLAEAGSTRTDIVIEERYQVGTRLYSKLHEFCEAKARLLASTIQSIDKDGIPPTVRTKPISGTLPATRSEVLLDEAIQSLVSQLIDGIRANGVARVAVFPITDGSRGKLSSLSAYLADKITNGLYATKAAKVVERTRLVRIMEELELTASPRFDDRSVKSVGKLAGVDAIVLGVYNNVGSRIIEVNVRLVSVETAELLGIGSTRIPEPAVHDLLF
jgi:hypothetical protein